jgi:hypothetical protein
MGNLALGDKDKKEKKTNDKSFEETGNKVMARLEIQ